LNRLRSGVAGGVSTPSFSERSEELLLAGVLAESLPAPAASAGVVMSCSLLGLGLKRSPRALAGGVWSERGLALPPAVSSAGPRPRPPPLLLPPAARGCTVTPAVWVGSSNGSSPSIGCGSLRPWQRAHKSRRLSCAAGQEEQMAAHMPHRAPSACGDMRAGALSWPTAPGDRSTPLVDLTRRWRPC
jgi:hypothetical protein